MFPARVPATNTSEYFRIKDNVDVSLGLGRTGMQQGGYQIVALLVTLCIAVVGGLITGKRVIILQGFIRRWLKIFSGVYLGARSSGWNVRSST